MSTLSKKKKVAITGLIGSGKSVMLNYLKQKGFKVFSADEYVAKLYETDYQLAQDLQALTNQDILLDGLIDKTKMKTIFFKDKLFKEKAEALIHQKVYDAIFSDKIEADFYEIPLLFESKRETDFDEILLVFTTPEIQKKRLIKYRNMSPESIDDILEHQYPVEQKLKGADVLFINDYSLEHLYYQIDKYLERRKNCD